MKELNKLLEVGSEGGSVILFQMKDKFFFTTEEFLFADEFDLDKLSSDSEMFFSVEEAIISLVMTYSIFQLHPIFVETEYKKLVKIYFDNFILYQGEENCWSIDDWRKHLN